MTDSRAAKPILFSGAMVRAITTGRKTQTRRVIQQEICFGSAGKDSPLRVDGLVPLLCPYGHPGDRLWVRETFLLRDHGKSPVYRAAVKGAHGAVEAAGFGAMYGGWKPSIFMPRWASRITLEITNVRVERVQEISEADAIAEGVDAVSMKDVPRQATMSRRSDFAQLWDSINAKRGFGWDTNPWVWCISFKRAE